MALRERTQILGIRLLEVEPLATEKAVEQTKSGSSYFFESSSASGLVTHVARSARFRIAKSNSM